MSLWLAAFVFLLSGLYAMQQCCHIRIYIIYDLMPRWMQKTADVISVLLIVGFTFALVCIQAVSNLIADWNKVTVSHTPADEVDEHEIEAIRRTLGEK